MKRGSGMIRAKLGGSFMCRRGAQTGFTMQGMVLTWSHEASMLTIGNND
jgi:hypothetical protein